ncbi:MAG: helix-turn-helix domain-containing protein [Parasporobacterium sp.]|nr:helix-turn-helix domain-containing protein [Parasporobacterium sp.]
MHFHQLLRYLNRFRFVIYDEANAEEEILGVKYLHEPVTDIAPDFLHYCPMPVFQKMRIPKGPVLSFVIWGCTDLEVRLDHVKGAHNIVLVEGQEDHIEVFNCLVDPFLKEQKYNVSVKEMTSALFSNMGLQNLANVAYSIFKKPIFITDTSYKNLARAFRLEDAEKGSSLYNHLKKDNKFLSEKGIAYIKEKRLNENIRKRNEPYMFYHDNFDCNAMAIGIWLRNVLIGNILMLERTMSFSEVDKQLFIAFRNLVCQELQKDASYQINRNEYASYFLTDLLTNRYQDEELMKRRLETVNYAVKDHLRILVIQQRGIKGQAQTMSLVASQLDSALRDHIYAIIENRLVVLLNFPEGKDVEGYLMEQIQKMVDNNQLIAGISSKFTRIATLDRHYRLAVRAALVGQKYFSENSLFFYDDVSDVALLERVDLHGDLLDFVNSSILDLRDYDLRNDTNFLYTLWMYSENAFSAQQTAAKMFIHKNTLVYRLGKIRELVQVDFTTGRGLFIIQMSLRILNLLGMISEKTQKK